MVSDESDSPQQTEPTPQELADGECVAEYDSAIERNSATFVQLSEVTFYSQPQWSDDEVTRLVNERYVAPITKAFEAMSGGILKMLYCQAIIAGVALTGRIETRRFRIPRRRQRYELHTINNELVPADVQILALLDDCDRLFTDCSAHLDGESLRVCAESIYSVVGYLFFFLDERAIARAQGTPQPADQPLIDAQVEVLDEARQYFIRSAQRDAQIRYFGGMVAGLLAVALASTVLASFDVPGDDRLADVTFVAGAVGAVVSVMSRMTTGNLNLRFEAGPWLVRFFGMFRPFIGAVLGLVLYATVAGGLLAVDPPSGEAKAFFFFAVIAFLAGFSERFAQDMLSITEARFRGRATKPEPQPEPKAADPAPAGEPGAAPETAPNTPPG